VLENFFVQKIFRVSVPHVVKKKVALCSSERSARSDRIARSFYQLFKRARDKNPRNKKEETPRDTKNFRDSARVCERERERERISYNL
jgi:hypothetical protein